ncbi:phage tail assembly chaperone [Pseudomonas sp. B21-010]|uniref:phage tail assembly chaperone n=1 Tax=Pseudomonas sp. B21-010 TaxID=2895471 RepID=UPI00215E421D|nr:phage tail assembly chaperone [Pseudomonas sp. B21-010]UVM63289.1 phage tail assembly chaperone [Pseudomonas sp. B21-010]
MAIFFCAETGGFYPGEPYGDAIDKVCVELAQKEYQDLRNSIDQGKEIIVVNGWPKAVDRITPPDQLIAFERNWRDSEIRNTEWLVTRHRDEQDLQLTPTLTLERFSELLAYRQALRDWPQAEVFPDIEFRPVAPAWIAEQLQ